MKDLLWSELRRFHRLALLIAGMHLLILSFLYRMSDLLQMNYLDCMPFLGAYLLVGLALAIAQVGSYRHPSRWLWLVHRPLSTDRIFLALAGSAMMLLLIVVVLPIAVVVAGVDLFTERVVDTRHYLLLLHVFGITLLAWLAGAHAVVSRYKAAVAVLAAPLLLGLHLISVWWLLLPMLLTIAWLGWVSMKSFRANRGAPIQGSITLLLTALPLQLGFFLLVFELGQFLFVTGSILAGTDPLNTEFPPRNGLTELERAEPREVLRLGLEHSTDRRAPVWRDELLLLEPVRIGANLQRFPLRHQLSNLNVQTQWLDGQRNVLWTFSHDRMQFLGRHLQTGAAQGIWGAGGVGDDRPFAEVPVVGENGLLMTRHTLYVIDDETQTQHRLIELPQGESFIGMPRWALDRLLVLSNQRLRVYRSDRLAASAFSPPLLDWSVDLPAGPDNFKGFALAELMDGWLLSAAYGDGFRQIGLTQFNEIKMPSQKLIFVDGSGRATTVGERLIFRDYPVLYQSDWWFSPPLHWLVGWPEGTLDKGLAWPLQQRVLAGAPLLYPVAALLLLLSFASAWWWLRQTGASLTRRYLWLISCGLLGVPALLSLICLEPRQTYRND